jgi:hypothetical protein
MLALTSPLPEHASSDPGMLTVVIALAASLIVVTFWLRARRLSAAAWVGRMEAGGPAVWRVPQALHAPERVQHSVSWGSDTTCADALAETVLRRVRRRPPPALVRGFAADVLGELPDDGFVLDERDVRAWLHTRRAPLCVPT